MVKPPGYRRKAPKPGRKIDSFVPIIHEMFESDKHVRNLTGYDRVIAYMFDSDLNGTVVAEDQRPDIVSYLHQRFPASDIPPQAMRLYKRKLVRMIADVGYEPQPIRVRSGAAWPLDLSEADLRSVSPIHIEYLKNMGVGGTLVCTLMAEGEVLGMLTCHHMNPRFITPTMRNAVGAVVSAAAHRVRALRVNEQNVRRAESFRHTTRILIELTHEDASSEGLGAHVEKVRTIIDAEGVAIVLGGRVFASGKVPPTVDVLRISEVLGKGSEGCVQHTDYLSSLDPSFERLVDCAAGAVRCTLAGEEGDAALENRRYTVILTQ